jgi:predicted Rossmann fold flavoprotein
VTYDVAVVGAGAAGLMAAIFAGRGGAGVVAIDGAKKLGAKILIAGGGRCNVTHDVVTPEDFNGSRNAVARVLRTFTVDQTIEFFRSLGVTLKREETGKLFPTTDRASTVLNALVQTAKDAGVEIITDARVTSIRPPFSLETTRGPIEARRVILAAGGRSVPKTGSDGSGYALVQSLGHTVTETFPGLVPLVIDGPHWIKELSGISADAELAVTTSTGKVLRRESGSLLLTHFGISGPVALDISRHWIAARREDPKARLLVNFLQGETFESLEQSMLDGGQRNPRATPASLLRGRVPDRILDHLAPSETLGKLSRDARRDTIRALTSLELPVSRDRGFDYAEVTAGGVPLNEIDVSTMASRRTEGLYLCGEILDVDGRIGGYNFQWAWASGRLAGIHAAGD